MWGLSGYLAQRRKDFSFWVDYDLFPAFREGLLHRVTSMDSLLKHARHWGAPVVAAIFFAMWCAGEAGRMGGPWPGLPTWSGTWPLIMMTLAIATSVWRPFLSLGLTTALLLGQFFFVIPQMYANHWPIYLGSFIALAFTMWTSPPRWRFIACGANLAFVTAMTFLMLSWRYGHGVGWFSPRGLGDRAMLYNYGWTLFAVLLIIAVAFVVAGLLLSLYQERGTLFHAQESALNSLRETEVDLIVEQERTRIARDLHDVLAHSLAVIAAQADGARYLSKDQPKAVLTALDTIAGSARSALIDAQHVIEGIHEDSPETPQPQLRDITTLIDGMHQGGLKVQQSDSGKPVELSSGQQVAVFRIVQECLTNALKHGGRNTAVRLHFDWSGPGMTLHISSTMPATIPGIPVMQVQQRIGRGLPGMRERAHLAGGWLTSGPDGEQFRVTVFIPFGHRDVSQRTVIDPSETPTASEPGVRRDGGLHGDLGPQPIEPSTRGEVGRG